MEQARSARLDNYCESIAEDRATMAHARADEQGSIQGALQEMKKRSLLAYKHAGVELAFVPGADKLRVRMTKDSSDSSAAAGDDAGAQAPDDSDVIAEGDADLEVGDEAEGVH